jgi:hypothetical protein
MRSLNDHFIGAEHLRQPSQPRAKVAERQEREGDDGLPVYGYGPAFRSQARAGAIGAGLNDQEFFHFIAVSSVLNAFRVAAQQIGGDTFETTLADGVWRLDTWKMAAEKGAFDSEEQQVALCRGEVCDRQGQIEFEPVMGSGCLQGSSVVIDVKAVPAGNSAIRDALLLVNQALDICLMKAA